MVTVQVLTSLQWIIKKETKQKRRILYVCVAATFNSIPPIEKVVDDALVAEEIYNAVDVVVWFDLVGIA